MNNQRRNNRRRGPVPSANVQTLSRRLAALKHAVEGIKYRPAAIPPPFVQIPWNSWTFERTLNTTGDLAEDICTVGTILGNLVSKIGTGSYRVKIDTAACWVTADGLIHPDFTTEFFELSGVTSASGQSPRSTQRSLGTLNVPARVGYHFPITDSKEVFTIAEQNVKVFRTVVVASGSQLTQRAHILWQKVA